VLYARGYRLTVSADPGNITLVNNTTVTDTFYEFASDFSGGETVYVTIVPFNDEGDAIGPCAEESFTIVSSATPELPECTNLVTPANNSVDVVVNTDLEWEPVANADGYRLRVVDTSNGSLLVNDVDVNNELTYEFASDLNEDTTHQVTITPYNSEGDAVSCITEEFRTQIIPTPPECTSLINPLNGATNVDARTNLSWTPVANATGYLVVVGITRGGVEVANNIDAGANTFYDFSEDLRENTTHYVTIIPYNEEGDAIACIEESFRTGTIPVVPSCTNLTNEDVAAVTTYDFASDLNIDTTYAVTITPYNTVGDAMSCTTEQFTTIANTAVPNCTNLTSPIADATDVVVDTNLTWSMVTDATGYRITVVDTSTNTNYL